MTACVDCDGCGLRFRSQEGTDAMAVDDCPTCGGTGDYLPAVSAQPDEESE